MLSGGFSMSSSSHSPMGLGPCKHPCHSLTGHLLLSAWPPVSIALQVDSLACGLNLGCGECSHLPAMTCCNVLLWRMGGRSNPLPQHKAQSGAVSWGSASPTPCLAPAQCHGLNQVDTVSSLLFISPRILHFKRLSSWKPSVPQRLFLFSHKKSYILGEIILHYPSVGIVLG